MCIKLPKLYFFFFYKFRWQKNIAVISYIEVLHCSLLLAVLAEKIILCFLLAEKKSTAFANTSWMCEKQIDWYLIDQPGNFQTHYKKQINRFQGFPSLFLFLSVDSFSDSHPFLINPYRFLCYNPSPEICEIVWINTACDSSINW